MEETNSNIEENEIKTKLFATPVAKLMEAQKRAEKFAEEKEAHNTCKELVKCVALTRIIYGNGHWRLAQAFANLAHSYLMLQGLPVQAKKHANSAKYSIFMRKSSPLASTEEREIQSTLVTIYYTLGVANLMQKNGKESYCNLQKAERIMEELQGTETTGFRVSERDLMAALGRASLQNNKLELAARYFEKAIEATISSGGETAPELISLYQEMAEMEQIKKNHEKAIRCLLQAYSTSAALYSKFSPQVASVALLLAKAYAATGEEKDVEAAEKYFTEGFTVYKEALGMDHFQTINAVEDYSKWLARTGKRKQAYSFLKESFKSQQDTCRDFNEQAIERLYIMGCICLAEEKIREAHLLLSKCVQIQVAIYGPHHRKAKKVQELLDRLMM
ncbi:tetratricopeptide repeat protein 23-like isoform X2 [Sceloporus undulatus]|uniref:tetratricopeptide repeat protein 23-like isoform X2 n=1 Tax=Sceloporus undulatus TaxID=8520 RepID=UPI001C4BEB8D|nr:tetratricopeptide repeat protein 23-like isoform X2 [Sceloporus undulatus]